MRRALPVVALVVVVGLTLGYIAGATASGAANSRALRPAVASLTGWRYSLGVLQDCEVGDGLALVRNTAASPIRVVGATLVVTDGQASVPVRASYELVEFPSGSGTTGELAGSFELASLRTGHDAGSLVGRELAPSTASGLWYDLVARAQLPALRTAGWHLRGLQVTYVLDGRTVTTLLAQSVALPASSRCSAPGRAPFA